MLRETSNALVVDERIAGSIRQQKSLQEGFIFSRFMLKNDSHSSRLYTVYFMSYHEEEILNRESE